jgi:hypothetical protein
MVVDGRRPVSRRDSLASTVADYLAGNAGWNRTRVGSDLR